MNNNVLSLLGLCKKSGNITLGFDACIESLNQKNSYLVLLTYDLSERTLKKIHSHIDNKIDTISVDMSMDDVRNILGKSSGIISINNKGFAEKIKQLLNT